MGKSLRSPEINAVHQQQLSADQQKRNEVDGVFGSGKQNSALKLIIVRLAKGAESSIFMGFLVLCGEYIRRLLGFFWCYFWLVLHLALVGQPLDGAQIHLAD
jgi:hypothetical protein